MSSLVLTPEAPVVINSSLKKSVRSILAETKVVTKVEFAGLRTITGDSENSFGATVSTKNATVPDVGTTGLPKDPVHLEFDNQRLHQNPSYWLTRHRHNQMQKFLSAQKNRRNLPGSSKYIT